MTDTDPDVSSRIGEADLWDDDDSFEEHRRHLAEEAADRAWEMKLDATLPRPRKEQKR